MTVVSAERTTRKVVVCYDIKAGRVVKGASFVGLTDQGDPADLVAGPAADGADELVLLDIVGAREGRAAFLQIVERACRAATVPVCVGGGVRSVDDVTQVLAAGADKVGMNSAAVADPELVSRAAAQFGSDRIVVAI
ncbi:MAG: HisA/HisF-related TIM barrel protein, partial [Trueperaceae bacterium]